MMWYPDIPESYRNQIITGDARELGQSIPDESVDLIFTDPPYLREYLPLYRWLSEFGARILKPGGLCVTMVGTLHLPTALGFLAEHLTYHWTFPVKYPQSNTFVWAKRVCTGWKAILSFSKGTYTGPVFGTDTLTAGATDKRFHVWGQDESTAAFFIEKFPGVICDPFCGGGQVPAVCYYLRRNYIAFEIDPETAARARERVANTQPPLFIAEPQQMALEIS